MTLGDKRVLTFYRTALSLTVLFLVPAAYFLGAGQADAPSIGALFALLIGGEGVVLAISACGAFLVIKPG